MVSVSTQSNATSSIGGIRILVMLLLAGISAAVPQDEKSAKQAVNRSNFAVVAYLPEWRYGGVDYDAISDHLTHLIFFSIEVDRQGSFAAMDRFPKPDQLKAARAAAERTGTKLLICFGGNSRSNGFSQMVASKKIRAVFVKNLVQLCDEHGLDGVDYNWEYPANQQDWTGLIRLIKDTHVAFTNGTAAGGKQRVITMAYYPDGRQEPILADMHRKTKGAVDLYHMMSYDQNGKHSTWQFGRKSVDQGCEYLPPARLTMGLPFYARHVKTGDWKTYEELVRVFGSVVKRKTNQLGDYYFNGIAMTERKVKYAVNKQLGGVMIWEIGQDTHSSTNTSLLAAITRAAFGAAPADSAGPAASAANLKESESAGRRGGGATKEDL